MCRQAVRRALCGVAFSLLSSTAGQKGCCGLIPIFHKNNRLTGLTLSLASVFTILTGTVQYYAHCLPDHLYAETDRPVSVATLLPMTVHSKEPSVPEVQEAELRLFGMFPVKTVSLTAVQPVSLFVGGEPFGVRMRMDGVMVVRMGEDRNDRA